MTAEELMRANLIALAQTYATAKGWSLATVSKQIHGNQAFLAEYFAGKMSPRVDTYFTMIEKLRREWPKGTKWPVLASIPKLGKKVENKRAAA
jgi:hypothetical protein